MPQSQGLAPRAASVSRRAQASRMNSFATTRWGWVFRIKFSAMLGASVSLAWPRSSG